MPLLEYPWLVVILSSEWPVETLEGAANHSYELLLSLGKLAFIAGCSLKKKNLDRVLDLYGERGKIN